MGIGMNPFGSVLLEVGNERLNGASRVALRIVVTLKKASKDPLRPFVVGRVACAHLAAPIVAEADLLELLSVAFDIYLGGNLGMLPRLDGILLSRQPKGIVAHRV